MYTNAAQAVESITATSVKARSRFDVLTASPVEVNDFARNLVDLEGQLEAYSLYLDYQKSDFPLDDLVDALTYMLMSGAGDTWSGRNNDFNRTRFDGFRAASKVCIRWAKREMAAAK